MLDLPQVDLKSFLASGASSLGREAPKQATKSRKVDLSRLRGCHLRFPPNMESGVTGLWGFKLQFRSKVVSVSSFSFSYSQPDISDVSSSRKRSWQQEFATREDG